MDLTTVALRDAGVLWLLDGEYQRVVDAAVEIIVAGTSTPEVDILAGSRPSDPFSERLSMVGDALDSLDAPALPESQDEVARESAEIIARQGDAAPLGGLACDMRERLENATAAKPPDRS